MHHDLSLICFAKQILAMLKEQKCNVSSVEAAARRCGLVLAAASDEHMQERIAQLKVFLNWGDELGESGRDV